MNKKLKKYQDFINESVVSPKLSNIEISSFGKDDANDRSRYLYLRDEFKEDILILEESYGTKFSDLCIGNGDPDVDYNEMKSIMTGKGWDIETIKNLFSKESDKLCGYDFTKFITKDHPSLDDVCGYIDIYG